MFLTDKDPSISCCQYPTASSAAQHTHQADNTVNRRAISFVCELFSLYVCRCVYIHTYVSRCGSQSTHVCVKPGGQLQVSSVILHLNFLTQRLPLNLDLILPVRLLGQPALRIYVRISTSPGLGYGHVLLCLAFYVVCGGSGLRSSCSHSKRFAHRARVWKS